MQSNIKVVQRSTDIIALKKIMIEKGYKTVTSLANSSNINRVTLGKVLDGKSQPSAEVMLKLVNTLGISASQAGEIFFADNLLIT